MPIISRLGEKIRKIRKGKKITQEKLAELAGIDPKSVIQIEGGKRNPTIKTLNQIARALGTTIEDILS